MADDIALVDDDLEAEVEEISDHVRDAATRLVARHATDDDDRADLLMMLGLIKGPDRAECPECSGPLSLATISRKCGLRNFCSAKCRDAATRAGR